MKRIILLSVLACICMLHIQADNYYWIGSAANNNWNDLRNWSSSSGGASDVGLLPTVNDNVIFDENSFQTTAARRTVTVNATAYCKNITFTNIQTDRLPTLTVNAALNVAGSMELMPEMTVNGSGNTISLISTQASETLTLNGVTLATHISIGGTAAWTVIGDINCSASHDFTCTNPNGLSVPGKIKSRAITFSGGGNMSVGDSIICRNITFSGDGDLTVEKTLKTTNNTASTITGAGNKLIKETLSLYYTTTITGGTMMVNGLLEAIRNCTVNGGCKMNVQGQVISTGSIIITAAGTEFTVGDTFSASTFNVSSDAKASINGNVNCLSIDVYYSAELNVNGHDITCGTALSVVTNGTLTGLGGTTVQCGSSWEYTSVATPALTPATAPALIRVGFGDFSSRVSDVYNNIEFYGNGTHNIQYGNCNKMTILAGNATLGYNNHPFTADSLIISSQGLHTLSATITVNKYLEIKLAGTCGMITIQNGAFAVGGSDVNVESVILKNQTINGDAGTYNAANSIDDGGNANWTFGAVASHTYYWVNGTGSWEDANHWATSSGGTGGLGCTPTPLDNVIFDELSGLYGTDTVRLESISYCDSMTWKNITGTPVFMPVATHPLYISGSLELCSGVKIGSGTISPNIYFDSNRPDETVRTNGVNMQGNYYFQSKTGAGGWKLLDDFNGNPSYIYFTAGTLDFNGKNVTISESFSSTSTTAGTRTLIIANSTIQVKAWSYRGTNRTKMTAVLSANSLIKATVTFDGGEYNPNDVYCNLEYNCTLSSPSSANYISNAKFNKIIISGSYVVFSSSSNTYPLVTDTLLLIPPRSGANYILNNDIRIDKYFFKTQCGGILSTLTSNNTNTRTIFMFGGEGGGMALELWLLQITKVNIQRASGTSTELVPFLIGNSIVTDASIGWYPILLGKTMYWVGGTGNWDDPTHWALTSNGTGGACIPSRFDNVIFDDYSFSGTGDTVYVNAAAACDSMTWTGATLSSFRPLIGGVAGAGAAMNVYGSMFLAPNMFMSNCDINLGSVRTAETLQTSGVRFNRSFYFENTSAKWEIDSLYTSGHLYLQGTDAAEYKFNGPLTSSAISFSNGYLDLSGQKVTATQFTHDSGVASRRLNIKDATITLSNGGWNYNGILPADSSANSVINMTYASASMTTAAGQVYNDVNFTATSGTGTLTSNGATFRNVKFMNPTGDINLGTYNRVTFDKNGNINAITADTLEFGYLAAYTYTFRSGVTSTVNKAWYASGNNCATHTLCSSTPGTRANISVAKEAATIALDPSDRDTLYIDFVNIKDLHAVTTAEAGSERAIIEKGVFSSNTGGFGQDGNNSGEWIWDDYLGIAGFKGLGTDAAIACNAYPYTLRSTYFLPGLNSTFEWRKGSATGTVIGTDPTFTLYSPSDLGSYYLTVNYTPTCPLSDNILLASGADTLVWTGALDADWNNAANWKTSKNMAAPIPPDPCTDVLIPENVSRYPNLDPTFTTYRTATLANCHNIHFEHGAEVVRTDSLHYAGASVDLRVKTHEWYMVSPPLKKFYTGDFYFSDPRPYNDSHIIETMYYFGTNPQTGEMSSINSAISGLFNTADIELTAGNGLLVWANKLDQPLSYQNEYTFHFPKQDTVYGYYKQGSDTPVSQTGKLDRTDNGRFIYEPLAADGYVPLSTKSDVPGVDNTIHTGNPFMAHLDFFKFLQDNGATADGMNGDIAPSYVLIYGLPAGIDDDAGQLGYTATYLWDGSVWHENYAGPNLNTNPGLIPPMQSFVICVRDPATLKVHVTSVATDAGNKLRSGTIASSPRKKLEILATRGRERNKALLLYEPGKSNGYDADDVRKLLFSSPTNPALDRPLAVYTVSNDNRGLDINTFGSMNDEIPVGIRTSVPGNITLKFSGMEEYDEPVFLHDRQTGAVINLSQQDEYTFNKAGNETYLENRLYLTFRSTTGIEKPAKARITIKSTASGITVASQDGTLIHRLQVTDMQGRKVVDKQVSAQEYTAQVPAGVYTVHATTAQGVENRKVIVE